VLKLPSLYAILDTAACVSRGFEPLDVAAAFLAGGATLLQLRDKQASSAARLQLADDVARLCRAAGAQLVVNDFVDIAMMSQASGVHVGQDDLPVAAVRDLLGPEAIVGLSTHDEPQIEAAATTTASYVAVGPIFGTKTKDTGYSARGLDLVRAAAATGKPIVAIGGITLDHAPDVLGAGAASVAVISDLLTGDPEARVRAYLRRLG
jgi:thiamine-phosphate pyrophosphorylase